MIQYIIRRLLLMIPVIVMVTIVLFVLIRLTPGDPVRDQFGIDITPENYAARKHQLGLDRPLPVQYVSWVGDLIHLNFGNSLSSHKDVKSVVFDRFPATLE